MAENHNTSPRYQVGEYVMGAGNHERWSWKWKVEEIISQPTEVPRYRCRCGVWEHVFWEDQIQPAEHPLRVVL